MLALLLSAASRCASAEFCPDNAAIVFAVQLHNDASAYALMRDRPESRDGVLFVHTARVKGISDVFCGDVLTEERPITVNCKFKLRYDSRVEYRVARLAKTDDGWEIDQTLGVSRRHR